MMDLTELEWEWLELNGYSEKPNDPDHCIKISDERMVAYKIDKLLPSRNADACEKELEWLARKYRVQMANEANGDGTHGWVIFIFEKMKSEFICVASHEYNRRLVILEAGVKARRRNDERT